MRTKDSGTLQYDCEGLDIRLYSPYQPMQPARPIGRVFSCAEALRRWMRLTP